VPGLAFGPGGRLYSATGSQQTFKAGTHHQGELRAWRVEGTSCAAVGAALVDRAQWYVSLAHVPCGPGRDGLLAAGTTRRTVVVWRVPGE
jgi:hypothetical protein